MTKKKPLSNKLRLRDDEAHKFSLHVSTFGDCGLRTFVFNATESDTGSIWLSVTNARKLRDWLSAWLDEEEKP